MVVEEVEVFSMVDILLHLDLTQLLLVLVVLLVLTMVDNLLLMDMLH